MKYNYSFKINEAELMEYYQYIFALNPKNKTRIIWIKICIPALIAFTLYFFKMYTIIWLDILAVVVSLLWIFVLSNKLWNRYISQQVDRWFKQNITSASYSQVNVNFEKEINVNGKIIEYSKLKNILPLKHVLVFFYEPNEIFIIPTRVIGNEDKIKTFTEMLSEQIKANKK